MFIAVANMALSEDRLACIYGSILFEAKGASDVGLAWSPLSIWIVAAWDS